MTVKSKLKLIRPKSLASVVQAEIECRIVDGDIAPGDRINENSMAAEMGVSRGPIREACSALVKARLLEFIVNRGCFVRIVSTEEAKDLYVLRASLMRLAGQLLAARITDQEMKLLREMVEEMAIAAAVKDFQGYYGINRRFHDSIVQFVDNKRLREICNGLDKELHLYRTQSISRSLTESDREHREIIEALASRDSEKAGEALASHIQNSMARFFSVTTSGRVATISAAVTGAKI
tara:strand:+ start:3451 stop:4158 length:708 start_codon:yes stop_codon:yes gene_type:complete